MKTRVQVQIRGVVQGVGFRPFVYSLAQRSHLKGSVQNTTSGLLIDVEGEAESIHHFVEDIRLFPPASSRIEAIECQSAAPAGYAHFSITESVEDSERSVSITPDLATCGACLREMSDRMNRRFRYPFINCANCGPRFTIIESVPYDRDRTTMARFPMCSECRSEYQSPSNRRFHAEATCCSVCGPSLSGTSVEEARAKIAEGKIVAIKGIGGFHLACDGLNEGAVVRLRAKKRREGRPFALMAPNLEIIRRFCIVSAAEEHSLLSVERPVVLLAKRSDASLPEAVAPGVNTLGFMLPYSPLHHLLVEDLDRPLVMTSGNISEEPICFSNQEALQRLEKIADAFVLHDRPILIRTDDSIVRSSPQGLTVLRRSRGFAPAPVSLQTHVERPILACGAELKNTFCLARGREVFVSHHIGDLQNLETYTSFVSSISHLQRLLDIKPDVIAFDLHPDYLSSKHALSLMGDMVKVPVQHHHAHVASCMAEHHLKGDVIGMAFDGIGFGTDGALWGGECFAANFRQADRISHLDYVSLPGGSHAIREPWRMALVYLQRAFGNSVLDLPLPFISGLDRRAAGVVIQMINTGIQASRTSSMGRLFDAVAALVGIRDRAQYEGQAAMELEAIADPVAIEAYPFDCGGVTVHAEPVIRAIVDDLLAHVPASIIAARFHNSVAELICALAVRVRRDRDLDRVVLSGGVFQNRYLLERACPMLQSAGFRVYTNGLIPPNDGGICVGQAMIANARVCAGEV